MFLVKVPVVSNRSKVLFYSDGIKENAIRLCGTSGLLLTWQPHDPEAHWNKHIILNISTKARNELDCQSEVVYCFGPDGKYETHCAHVSEFMS